MLYITKLKYLFCLPTARTILSLEQAISLLRYLNNVGVSPYVLAGSNHVVDHLTEQNILFNEVGYLPSDYDIMFTPGMGYDPFERYWLERSMEIGKINFQMVVTPTPANYQSYFFDPKRTTFLHGICAADVRTVNNLKTHNSEVVYPVTGVPLWDRFSTPEFHSEVPKVRNRFGKKLLVVGCSCECDDMAKEMSFYEHIVNAAESQGFKVILQVHPGKEHLLKGFKDHINPGIERHSLFAAASHVIGNINSIMMPECMFLETKVGCKSLGVHYKGWRHYPWFDNPSDWYSNTIPLYGEEYLSVVPLINDDMTLRDFLSSDELLVNRESFMNYFGMPKVNSFTENYFKTIEMYFTEDNKNNIKRLLEKNNIVKGREVDFSFWDIGVDTTRFRGITRLRDFITVGVNLLKQGMPREAIKFLKRAEMFSGTSHFDVVQYLLAMCYFEMGSLSEAEQSIYQSLLVKPDCKEYRILKTRIDAVMQKEDTLPLQVIK